jgi:HEAT repeat protein
VNEDTATPVPEEVQAEEDQDEIAAEVVELVNSFLKAVRAQQTYVAENPLVQQFRDEVGGRFEALWSRIPHLTFGVDEGRLVWNDHDVYSHPVGQDNFAFQFFKDGIRQLAFLPGVERSELDEFLLIVGGGPHGRQADMVAQIWHRDFDTIRIEFVDVSDEDLDVPEPNRMAGAGESLEDISELEEAVEAGPIPPEEEAAFANLVLGEADVAYLRREMEAEWQRNLVRDVVLALLDQFEMRDHERRRQVVDVMREQLPRLLTDRNFANVALILNELQLLANKTGEEATQHLVTSLLRDMSEAVAEMVTTSERDAAAPAGEELTSLLGALQAEAIPTLVRAIPSVSNQKMRQQLTDSLDRLVAAYPVQLSQLLNAEDPVLAAEAAGIVGRLKIVDLESNLIELASRPEPVTRRAAILALTAIGSLAGMEALAAALGDTGREVRLAAVEAVAELKPAGAEDMLKEWLLDSAMEDRDNAEQIAFFKAFGQVAGDGGVPVLDKILNGRKWFGGRHSAAIRGAAARSLGMIGSDAARSVLQKAANDKVAPVRSSVRVAMRFMDSSEEK